MKHYPRCADGCGRAANAGWSAWGAYKTRCCLCETARALGPVTTRRKSKAHPRRTTAKAENERSTARARRGEIN